jgi:hypothetical protein
MAPFKKAAIELSMNFLVMMIIAITIFGFGVQFVYRISSQAVELKDITADELDSRVDDLLCSSSTKVCIGKDTQTIQRGEFKAYGVKILNVEDEKDFIIRISQPTPDVGFKKGGEPITTVQVSGKNIEFSPMGDRDLPKIPRNGEQLVGVGVTIPDDAIAGTYILNVNIFKEVVGGGPYDYSCVGIPANLPPLHSCYVSMQKLYVNVP